MQQVLPGVYTFSGLLAGRVYLLRDDDGLTLVDTSISNAGGKILAQLKEAGHQPGDVKRILITHAHSDHVGSLPMVQAATEAEVWCHALEQPVIEGKIPMPRRESRIPMPETTFKPTPVHRTLAEGEVLPILGNLHVMATPGHAPGHISFWQPERSMLIVGDVIFYFFNRMTLPLDLFTVDMDENKRSVQKLAALKPESLLFGHGQPIVGGAHKHLAAFTQRLGL